MGNEGKKVKKHCFS